VTALRDPEALALKIQQGSGRSLENLKRKGGRTGSEVERAFLHGASVE
jgi:hypothetical protein